MSVSETTTVIRVPNDILPEIQQYIAHYRAIGKYAVDTKKAMKDFSEKTEVLNLKTTVTLTFEL